MLQNEDRAPRARMPISKREMRVCLAAGSLDRRQNPTHPFIRDRNEAGSDVVSHVHDEKEPQSPEGEE